MVAYVSVTNHPYFDVTGREGAFELRGVPAGTYELEAWHEVFGTKTAQVTVADDSTAEVTFSYTAQDAA